jgi:hypothetical protein
MPEEAVMEAIPEGEAGARRERVWRERCMCGKGTACETLASEMWSAAAKVRAGAHCPEMWPAAHSASHGMHSHPTAAHGCMTATKAATAHGAMTATTKAAAAEPTAPAASRERWWRKRERRTKRARNETTEKLAIHPILHRSELLRDCYRRNQ